MTLFPEKQPWARERACVCVRARVLGRPQAVKGRHKKQEKHEPQRDNEETSGKGEHRLSGAFQQSPGCALTTLPK